MRNIPRKKPKLPSVFSSLKTGESYVWRSVRMDIKNVFSLSEESDIDNYLSTLILSGYIAENKGLSAGFGLTCYTILKKWNNTTI